MMLIPCGPSAVPTGGAGVALPAWIWRRTTVLTFFLPILLSVPLAKPLDLKEVELHRRLPAKHVDEHLKLALLGIDLGDLAMEIGEGPVDHPHALVDLVLDGDLGRGLRSEERRVGKEC